jgi:hypothetical protein
MAASYPSATKSFSTKTPGQSIASAHVNDLQDEVVAVENGLRSGLAHNTAPATDIAYNLGAVAFRWLRGFFGAGTVALPSVSVSEADCGLYSSGTNALDFATNGTKALGIDSTQFIDSPTQPRARAYHGATQSINDSTVTVLSMNSEDYDVGTCHDTVTNNSRLTVPTGGDGLYLVIAKASFAANATGQRNIRIRKNGGDVGTQVVGTPAAAIATNLSVSLIDVAAAGDYYEAAVFQSSTGALNTGSATRVDGNEIQFVKLW